MFVDPVLHSSFSNIFFIDTSTIATIETGLKNIAVMKDSGNSPQDGLLWLTRNIEGWLLFFDNADDPNFDLFPFLPRCNHGNIIITSRNPQVARYGDRSNSLVGNMDETDAVELLLRGAVKGQTADNVQKAAEIVKVCCITLSAARN